MTPHIVNAGKQFYNQHSLDLILLTIQHLHLAIINVQSEIEKADIELRDSISPGEYDRVHETLKDNFTKLREQILQSKIKKLEMDTKDYMYNRVYLWAEE